MKLCKIIMIGLVIFTALLPCAVAQDPLIQESWCGNRQILFFQNDPSPGIPGYEQLINYPSGATEVDESVVVISTGGPVLIDTYISPPGEPDALYLLKGLRRYRTFSYVSSASGTTRLNFTPFIRYANGTEMNLYTVLTDDINDLVVAEYLTSYTATEDYYLGETSRFGIRVTANTTQPSPITVHWVYEGNTHYSSVENGFFNCTPASELCIVSNSTYTNSPPNANPLSIVLFAAITGIVLLIASFIAKPGLGALLPAMISPPPLLISAWQSLSIDIPTAYGSSASGSTYVLMESHTIYQIYPIAILLFIFFIISLLNIYRVVTAIRFENERDGGDTR